MSRDAYAPKPLRTFSGNIPSARSINREPAAISGDLLIARLTTHLEARIVTMRRHRERIRKDIGTRKSSLLALNDNSKMHNTTDSRTTIASNDIEDLLRRLAEFARTL